VDNGVIIMKIPFKWKVIHKHECFGCGHNFKSRAKLVVHQGDFWPGCLESSVKARLYIDEQQSSD